MGWTQPICERCYAVHFPGRGPVTVAIAVMERCCMCGATTGDGIYIRADPRLVAFPAQDQTEGGEPR